MEDYKNFRDALLKCIKNKDKSQFSQNFEDCYLIEENLFNKIMFNDISKCFDEKRKYIFIPKNEAIFISTFKSIIEHIINGKKLKIINKKIAEFFLDNRDYLKNSIIKYYAGNNQLIIEYKDKKDDKALLIINPLDQVSIKNRAFILSINNTNKLELFKELLSKENNYALLNQYKKYVMSPEEYLNINSNQKISQTSNVINSDNNNQNNIFEFRKEIINILINIFYYWKYLKEKKEEIFNDNNSFYLINIEWLTKFLENYDYQKLYNPLINISKKYPNINYFNFKNKNVIEYFCKKELDFKTEINKDILDIEKIIEKMKMNKTKDFFSFNNCYTMPLNIISLINKFIIRNKTLQNDMKKMYLKNKDIYFIDSNRIIIGNLHNEIFIPKYILLLYDTQNIINAEKEISYSNEIEDYIISKNCDINIIC